MQLENFFNDGFGWVCRACDRELNGPDYSGGAEHARYFREGEAEAKKPKLSNPALAKWLDPARTTLTCPRCGVTEPAEKQ